MKESIKKDLLKKLIKEVIKEVDAMTAEPTTEPETGEPLPHTSALQKHKGDIMVKLSLKGAKSGPALKKFLGQLAYVAKINDLQSIHAEIEKSNGQKLTSMDMSDLEANRPRKGDDGFDDSPFTKRQTPPPADPEAGAAEWKAMTARDVARGREEAKLRKQQGLPPENDDEA